MNQAAIEIAKILLEFEIEQLEYQKNTSANGYVSEATPKAEASTDQPKVNRLLDSTPRQPAKQKKSTRVETFLGGEL